MTDRVGSGPNIFNEEREMTSVAQKLSTRMTNLGFAFILAVSSLTALAPFIFTRDAGAEANTVFGGVTLTEDRTTPSGGFDVTGGVLTMSVDNTKASAGAGFYRTEGLQGTIPTSWSIESELYVDATWAGKPVRAGLWGITSSNTAEGVAWPIIEYTTVGEGGFTGWRVFDTMYGGWTNLSDVAVSSDSWYKLNITYNPLTNKYDYYVNSSLVYSLPASDGSDTYDKFTGVIFNNFNSATNSHADDYSVKWRNLAFQEGEAPIPVPENTHFEHNGTPLTDGSTVSYTDGIKVVWSTLSTPARYRVTATHPDGTKANFQPSTSVSWNPASISWNPSDSGRQGFFGAEPADKGEGTYSYTVAVQVNGKWSSESQPVTLTYDNTSPSVTISQPTTDGIKVKNSTNVVVTGTDNLELKTVTAHLYDSVGGEVTSVWQHPSVNGDSYTLTLPLTGLADGDYLLKAAATDESGESVYATRNFTIDTTPPTVPTINNPLNGDYFNTTPIKNQWNVSTDNYGILGYQIAYHYDNGHEFGGSTCPDLAMDGYTGFVGCRDVNGTQRDHIPGINEQGGVTTWVRAKDIAGNYSAWSDPVHYYYDATAPDAPELEYPIDGVPINGSTPKANDWTDVVDADHYIYESYNVDASGNPIFTPVRFNSTYTDSQTNSRSLENGLQYFWRVKAVDAAGNESDWSELWKTVVDNQAPIVEITNPENGGAYNTNVIVKGTVTDPNLRHYWLNVKHNGVVIHNETVLHDSFDNMELITLTDEGEYDVTLAARDSVGGGDNTGNRSGDSTVSFTIDKTLPTVGFTYSSSNPTKDPVTVTLNTDEPIKPPVDWTQVDDHTYTLTVNENTSGTVEISDLAGNSSDLTYAVTWIDITPPETTISSSTQTTNTPVISGTVDDASAIVTLTVNGISYNPTIEGLNWSQTVGPLADGTYNIEVYATDPVGNVGATDIATLTVNTASTSAPTTDGTGQPEITGATPTQTSTVTPTTPAITNFGVAAFGGAATGTGDPAVQGATTDNTPAVGGTSTEKVAQVDTNGSDGTIFGLAWYWWILILAGLTALIWGIVAAMRRREEA